MKKLDDSAKRKVLAERMSRLLGLPATQIEQLIPLVDDADLGNLESMSDADFLRESTRLINDAQRQQFAALNASAPSAPEESANATEDSTPKLRPLKKVGQPNAAPRTLDKPSLEKPSLERPGLERPGLERPSLQRAAGGGGGNRDGVPPGFLAELEVAAPPPEERNEPGIKPRPANVDESPQKEEPVEPVAVAAPVKSEPDIHEAESKISSAFKRQEKTGKLVGKQLILVAVGGGLVILIFLILGISMLVNIFKPVADTGSSGALRRVTSGASISPESLDELIAFPVSSEAVETVTPVDFTDKGQWGIAASSGMEFSVMRENLLGDAIGFTVEMWLKVNDANQLSQLSLESLGSDQTFNFGLVKGRDTGLQTQFTVRMAGVSVGAITAAPPVGRWVHVAGVYDPAVGHRLAIYMNGRMVAEAPLMDGPHLTGSGYKVSCVTEGTAIAGALSSVRLSSGIRYSEDFVPEPTFAMDPTTLSLLPIEKLETPGLIDLAQGDMEIPTVNPLAWVPVTTSSPLIDASGRIAFPPELLDRLEAEQGVEARNEFLKAWNKLSMADRQSYLREIGYGQN